jgi:hypothetical protein
MMDPMVIFRLQYRMDPDWNQADFDREVASETE